MVHLYSCGKGLPYAGCEKEDATSTEQTVADLSMLGNVEIRELTLKLRTLPALDQISSTGHFNK